MTNTVYNMPSINFAEASRWKQYMAMLFGRRTVGYDGAYKMDGYWYRGILYVVRLERQP